MGKEKYHRNWVIQSGGVSVSEMFRVVPMPILVVSSYRK